MSQSLVIKFLFSFCVLRNACHGHFTLLVAFLLVQRQKKTWSLLMQLLGLLCELVQIF